MDSAIHLLNNWCLAGGVWVKVYRCNLRLGVHFSGIARVGGRLQNKKEEGPPDSRRLVAPSNAGFFGKNVGIKRCGFHYTLLGNCPPTPPLSQH